MKNRYIWATVLFDMAVMAVSYSYLLREVNAVSVAGYVGSVFYLAAFLSANLDYLINKVTSTHHKKGEQINGMSLLRWKVRNTCSMR